MIAFLKAFGPLIMKLVELTVDLIELIQEYFAIKKTRLKNQFEEEIKARKKAELEQHYKEKANVLAFSALEDQAWKTRHEQILLHIKNKTYDDVIRLIHEIDRPDVNEFLFDESLGESYRALKIINIMKQIPQ